MPIIQENGRWRSVRTVEERKESAAALVATLSPREKAALAKIVAEWEASGRSKTANEVAEVEWEEQPLPVREWLLNEDLVGETGTDMYPQLRDDLVELFEGDYSEAVLTGCVDQDALVQCSDGSMPRLRDLIGRSPPVLTVDPRQGVMHGATTPGVNSGIRAVVELTLWNGMRVRLTPEHKVMTSRGWVDARDLAPDVDRVVVPRRIHYTPSNLLSSDAEIKLMAYWTTDGSSDAYRARYCDGRKETGQEVIQALRACGFDATTDEPYPKNGAWEVLVARFKTSGFGDWLKRHGLTRPDRTATVEVPDAVCRAPLNQVALFLNRVWAAEGTVFDGGRSSVPRCQLGMKSRRFIEQVQMLLLRFGVGGRIGETAGRRNGKPWTVWTLQVAGVGPITKFLDSVGPIYAKEVECVRIRARMEGKRANTNVDVVPFTYGDGADLLVTAGVSRSYGGMNWNRLALKERRFSRTMFARFCADFGALKDVEPLRARFPETLAYELVKSVEGLSQPIAVADIGVPGTMCFVANGITCHNSIGWGKDYFATTACVRLLYELCCLKNPQHALGLAAGEPIHFVPISRTIAQANRVVFGGICKKLALAPWFKGRYEETMEEVRFRKKGIYIIGGASQDAAALGLNVLWAAVDESNFFGEGKVATGSASSKAEDKATMIYNALGRRIKARYKRHGVRGMIMLVSSKRATTDFTERRIRRASKDNDRGVFVRDYAIWNVHPEPFENQKWYRVAVSAKEGRCKLLERDDEQPSPGALVFKVPEDYLDEFRNDPDGATRDVAGIATDFVGRLFITRRAAIDQMFDRQRPNLFKYPEWTTGTIIGFKWSAVMTQNAASEPVPICCPNATRHVHLDMSTNHCATALALAHRAGSVTVRRRDPETNKEVEEEAAVVHVDGILRIIAPDGGDVDHSEVRGVVYRLISEGYPVQSVSMDQYMATPNLQMFKGRGLKTAEVGERVAKLRPYLTLRQALYEQRIVAPYHEILDRELRELEFDERASKVRHTQKGGQNSKDLADALAGVVYYLSEHNVGGQPLGPSRGLSVSETADPGPRWTAQGDVIWPDDDDMLDDSTPRRNPGGGGEGGFPSWIIR